MMKLNKYGFLMIVLSALVAFSSGMGKSDQSVNTSMKFKNLRGNTVDLKHYAGQITVLNLWSAWSASCVKEMPVLERIYQDYYARNIKVVGIAVFSDNKKIAQMLRLTKVSYPILIADSRQAQVFGNLSIIPQTFILDANGNILRHFSGSQSYHKLSAVIDELIEARSLTKNGN